MQLKMDGQLVPGIAVRNGERRTLIAGHYRRRGLVINGTRTMRLMVYDSLSEQEMYALSYKENHSRNEQSPLDTAMAWKKLLEDGVYDSAMAIAERIGMSKGNVNKTLAITRLDPAVLELAKDHRDKLG